MFAVDVRMRGTAVASTSLAEGSFDVPFDVQDSLGLGVVQLSIEIGRMKFGAELLGVSSLSAEAGQEEVFSSGVEASAAPVSRLQGWLHADLRGGALQLSAPLAQFHEASIGNGARGLEDVHRGGAVEVELGATRAGARTRTRWRPGGTSPLLITLEPHLGRFARLVEGQERNLNADARVVLPFAVASDKERSGEAFLWVGGPGPVAMRRDAGPASWRVPTVSLHWILSDLVPMLAPNVSQVSLVVRRSAVVGSAWEVLSHGLTADERARLSQLSVEWQSQDSISCIDAALSLISEGFSRRGPILCDRADRVEMSFKREAAQRALWEPRASATAPGALHAFPLAVANFVVAVHHRFPISLVRHGASATEASTPGFAVQFPDVYDAVWVEASSLRARGSTSWRTMLGNGMGADHAFLLTLEPREDQWLRLLSAGVSGFDADEPPGWSQAQHFVIPATIYEPADHVQSSSASEGSSVPGQTGGPSVGSEVLAVSLPWVVDHLLGGRGALELALRDPLLDVRPLAAAGRHVQRFNRVWLQSSGAASTALAVGCGKAMRWAARHGFGLVRGRCPHANDTSTFKEFELVFDRLGAI